MLFSTLFSDPISFFAFAVALIIGITVHEFSHALAANWLGDPTPASQGRISLNPLKHLDLLGTLFLLFAGFGWGKPVQFNPAYLKNPKMGAVWIGLAGPTANLAVVLFFGVALKLLAVFGSISPDNGIVTLFSALVLMNLILLVFNLIPIPPLDGSKVLLALLPPGAHNFSVWLQKNGMFLLFGLIILDVLSPVSFLGIIFSWFANITFKLIFGA